MCLREGPPPVFIDIGGTQSPFLDDLFGETIADVLRGFFGFPQLHSHSRSHNGFGFIDCPHMDSGYLINAFSSVWAFCVLLLAITSGFMLLHHKRVALALLGNGFILSLLDTGTRLAGYSAGPRRDMMLENLPGQLAANALFQLALPCLAALALMRLAMLVRRLLAGAHKTPA